ncbi:uncharacterized protein A1O9_00043 [Exophiala aquamarina CBS 119918]|uniref:Uncharacterized protein n=1 Tax=Exophiala aquamarina CBS 119918 TaxID=1182545 RepID=A0A072PQA9_9EURO|nr:uncharacterized protein A1O9_00043 [Exophiala aquamarina CBS 119918]KEF62071.1 hypothetical protein A1O9_00043 [Exophiala aquamarina CBS 119918]
MHIPFTATLFTALFGLAALSPVSAGAVLGRAPQNGNRPVPSGACCVANTSLKQDACTAANGAAGRCVPGGNDCGGRLSCVATANLECDANVIERGNTLCRAKAPGGGLFDGANIIQSLAQATVN